MKRNLTPKKPSDAWLQNFLQEGLWRAKPYAIDMPPAVKIKLDQNECPWDFPESLKDKILAQVKRRQWNRYPNPMADELTAAFSEVLGLPRECILTGPGSNQLITVIFEVLGRRSQGKVVIARPSFALFESHCRYAGIPYETWDLDEKLEFSLAKLPDLPPYSVVVFASPNNPTGTSLSYAALEGLLKAHPNSLFIADEAYNEFADEPYTPLLAAYSNLLIIRTMSKNMGAAGVRCGYVLGSENLITQIKKMRLPYLLNYFATEAAKTILLDNEVRTFVDRNIRNAKAERERVYAVLAALQKDGGFQVPRSQANFLLLRWPKQEDAQYCYRRLIEEGILVRDVSASPGLQGCLRVSIGAKEENDAFMAALKKICLKKDNKNNDMTMAP